MFFVANSIRILLVGIVHVSPSPIMATVLRRVGSFWLRLFCVVVVAAMLPPKTMVFVNIVFLYASIDE